MKALLLFLGLLIAITGVASAYIELPFIAYLEAADDVYFAQVTSSQEGMVTFNVTEVLKGKPEEKLVLKVTGPSHFFEASPNNNYSAKSEWLLVSFHPDKNTVGWQHNCGWIPASVVRGSDGKVYVQDGADHDKNIHWDMAPDGTTGLTLDHIKSILKEQPKKP